MMIRKEEIADYDAVYYLVKEAFETAAHSDGNEQELVAMLRKSRSFIPELSLVAEEEGHIVGHILFTEGKVGKDTVLILAPLSVRPDFQRQGVGSALVLEGHRIARRLNYAYALVLGSETYYPRMGYVPAEQFGITVPEGIPPVNFMAIKLREDAPEIGGSVLYAKEFGLSS